MTWTQWRWKKKNNCSTGQTCPEGIRAWRFSIFQKHWNTSTNFLVLLFCHRFISYTSMLPSQRGKERVYANRVATSYSNNVYCSILPRTCIWSFVCILHFVLYSFMHIVMMYKSKMVSYFCKEHISTFQDKYSDIYYREEEIKFLSYIRWCGATRHNIYLKGCF